MVRLRVAVLIAILLIICVGQSSCTEVGKKGDWRSEEHTF